MPRARNGKKDLRKKDDDTREDRLSLALLMIAPLNPYTKSEITPKSVREMIFPFL